MGKHAAGEGLVIVWFWSIPVPGLLGVENRRITGLVCVQGRIVVPDLVKLSFLPVNESGAASVFTCQAQPFMQGFESGW